MAATPANAEVFQALQKLLTPFAAKLSVQNDSDTNFHLATKNPSWKGKPMFFAAVMRKSYVSHHLMPLYWKPQLADGMSPALRKRMHGKSCFNFAGVEVGLFNELASLTKRGFDEYKAAKFL